MNLQSEMNKPVLLTEGGGTISLREFKTIRLNAVNESALTRALGSKHIAFSNQRVESYPVDQSRQLAVARLRASPEEKFEFIDGKVFSATEAIKEIERGSAAGKYFTDLEKRAAAIAIKAVEDGKA
jgi:hypothetical protein